MAGFLAHERELSNRKPDWVLRSWLLSQRRVPCRLAVNPGVCRLKDRICVAATSYRVVTGAWRVTASSLATASI
jgi:hypothetical protein